MSGTRKVTGAYIGTGSAFNITTVGFRPRSVKLWNITGLTTAVWTEEMPDASAFKQINHADTQNVWVTANGITPLANGFTVGTDADINTDAETVYYEVSD
jgi:hypothetical protein